MSSIGGYLISLTFLRIHHGRDEKNSELMQHPITAKYSEMMQYPITAKYSEMMQYSIITQDTDPRPLFYGSVLYLELSELSYSDMFSSQNKKLLKMTINAYKQLHHFRVFSGYRVLH
jgi:hypothetical protein